MSPQNTLLGEQVGLHAEPSRDSAQGRQSLKLTSRLVDPLCQQGGKKCCLLLKCQTEGDLGSSIPVTMAENLGSLLGVPESLLGECKMGRSFPQP